MPDAIDREGLRRLVDDAGAQVVEVLPRPEYDWAHIPGAVHLSLKDFSADAADSSLDRQRPSIVYCNDFL